MGQLDLDGIWDFFLNNAYVEWDLSNLLGGSPIPTPANPRFTQFWDAHNTAMHVPSSQRVFVKSTVGSCSLSKCACYMHREWVSFLVVLFRIPGCWCFVRALCRLSVQWMYWKLTLQSLLMESMCLWYLNGRWVSITIIIAMVGCIDGWWAQYNNIRNVKLLCGITRVDHCEYCVCVMQFLERDNERMGPNGMRDRGCIETPRRKSFVTLRAFSLHVSVQSPIFPSC